MQKSLPRASPEGKKKLQEEFLGFEAYMPDS